MSGNVNYFKYGLSRDDFKEEIKLSREIVRYLYDRGLGAFFNYTHGYYEDDTKALGIRFHFFSITDYFLYPDSEDIFDIAEEVGQGKGPTEFLEKFKWVDDFVKLIFSFDFVETLDIYISALNGSFADDGGIDYTEEAEGYCFSQAYGKILAKEYGIPMTAHIIIKRVK